MKVTQTIQSTDPFNTGVVEAPAQIVFYQGDDLVQAISALVSAAAAPQDRDFFRVLSVNLHIAEPEN